MPAAALTAPVPIIGPESEPACFLHEDTHGNEVFAMYRDPQSGTLWLGTACGLMRYDDNMLTSNYATTWSSPVNQPIKHIQPIADGKLLLTTFAKEYYTFDPVSNVTTAGFSRYMEQIGLKELEEWLTRIHVDAYGTMWIYSADKLYSYNKNTDKEARLRTQANGKIIGLATTDKNFYIATQGRISLYDRSTSEEVQHVDTDCKLDAHDLRHAVDSQGNLWIGSNGLQLYDIHANTCIMVLENFSVADISASPDGDIYIATNSEGLVHYDYGTSSFTSIRSNLSDPSTLMADRMRAIYVDCDNNLWVSYSKGGISVSNQSLGLCRPRHIADLKHPNLRDDIISLACDRNGHLWLGTDGYGLYHTRMTADNTAEILRCPDIEGAVTCQYIDTSDRKWIGLYRAGVACMDPNGQGQTYLNGLTPFSITEDAYGNIYAGTLGDGIFRISPQGVVKKLVVGPEPRTYALQLCCDRRNYVYAAMSNGLGLINTTTGQAELLQGSRSGTQKFAASGFQSVLVDSRNLVWLISSDPTTPMQIYDQKADSILSIPGLENMALKSIVEDDNKNLWIASESGIINIAVSYDTQTESYLFRKYIYDNRLIHGENSHFNYRAVTKSAGGTLVFGTTNGFIPVIPNLYDSYRTKRPNKLHFAAVKINNRLINTGHEYNGHVILKRNISVTESLDLNHDENNISLYVADHDYSSPFTTPYLYRLSDTDPWLPIEGSSIDLFNIPPGHYNLAICGQNPDGTLTEALSKLKINVSPPWYMGSTAHLVFGLVVLVLIAVVISYFTERQRQRFRLQQAEKEIQRQQQLNEVKLRFFTNISHDFRTPLSLIITPLEYYMRDKKGTPDEALLQPVYKNAVRLLNLINQILDFRKLEVCGTSLTSSGGNIVAFVREVCSSFTIFAEDSEIALDFTSNVRELQTMFDKDKVSKIMMNLLSNAFKHTQPGGRVQVSVEADEREVRISVADSGPGIPDSEKTQVFDRFYQSNPANASTMGCGIGLHIVKEYVTLHGGTVKITDNHPSGVVFTVALPIVAVKGGLQKMESEGTLPETDNSKVDDNTPSNLLIVEDNEEFRSFLSYALAGEYIIHTAGDGADALDVLEKQDVDIVVSDIMMDGMDGLELCRAIKTDIRYSHIPVILLTAKALIEDEIQGLEFGADDYVTKPFNLSVLKLRLHNQLRNRDRSHINFKTKVDVNPSEITITPLDEQFIAQAIAVVETNISDPDFSVERLSVEMNLHRTHLYRKVMGITGKTPVEFIRLIRLKRACQYLRQSQMYISEIAYAVGFNSPKLFSKYFKSEFNISPTDYMKTHRP